MRTLILAMGASLAMASCTENTDNVNPEWKEEYNQNPTSMEWESQLAMFPSLKADERATYNFKFTNTGDNPLVIKSVKPSCGCTVPDKWPHDPIPPGGTGEIQVVYTSTGKPGMSTVTVIANTQPGQEHKLQVRANMKDKNSAPDNAGEEVNNENQDTVATIDTVKTEE